MEEVKETKSILSKIKFIYFTTLIILILLSGLSFYFLFFQNNFFTKKILGVINGNFTPSATTDMNAEEVNSIVYDKIKGVEIFSESEIEFTAEEIEALMLQLELVQKNIDIKIEEGDMYIYSNIFTPEKPIYVYSKINIFDSKKIALKTVGFGCCSLPSAISEKLGKSLLKTMKIDSENIFSSIGALNNIEITSAVIEDGLVKVKFKVVLFK